MIKIILIATGLLATGCQTIDNSYDSKCKCSTDSQGVETCKCKDYDRSDIYNDFDAPGTLIYDQGQDVVYEDMTRKIIFSGANL